MEQLRDDEWTVQESRSGFRLRILPPKNEGGKMMAGVELASGEVRTFEQTEEGKRSLWKELLRLEEDAALCAGMRAAQLED